MTNKKIISFECERLENIRQYLISRIEKKDNEKVRFYIKELGEIIYELTEKIRDEKT